MYSFMYKMYSYIKCIIKINIYYKHNFLFLLSLHYKFNYNKSNDKVLTKSTYIYLHSQNVWEKTPLN